MLNRTENPKEWKHQVGVIEAGCPDETLKYIPSIRPPNGLKGATKIYHMRWLRWVAVALMQMKVWALGNAKTLA